MIFINLSNKFDRINCVTISGYYRVNRLAKIQLYGYIRYRDGKNY